MASWANLVRSGSNPDQTSYTSDSFTVTSGKPVLFSVLNARASAAATPTITPQTGVTATELATVSFVGGARRLTLYWLTGSGTGTIDISFGAQTQTACGWSADEGTGVSTATPSGGDIVSNSGGSATSGSADLTSVTAGNHVYAVLGLNTNTTVDPGTGFTEIGTETAVTTLPAVTIASEYRDNSDDATADFTFGSAQWAVIAVEAAPAASGTTLVVQDATHAHTADSVALTQVHALTVADSTHGHSTDAVTLTQTHVLAVADSSHAHTADSPALTQAHTLVVADALHAHEAENVVLSTALVLTVQDGLHGHTADGLTLTQVHVLTVQDGAHPHTADNVSLTQAHALAVADALHAHSADSVAIGQSHVLVVADALHAHTADLVVLSLLADAAWRRFDVRPGSTSRDDASLVGVSRDDGPLTGIGRRDGG